MQAMWNKLARVPFSPADKEENAMNIVDTQIREASGPSPSFTVEFTSDGGDLVSVQMKQDAGVCRENAVASARDLIARVGQSADSEAGQQG